MYKSNKPYNITNKLKSRREIFDGIEPKFWIVIDGVDYELARTHFADDESLLDMFRMFRGMINDDADELENYYGQTQNGMFN